MRGCVVRVSFARVQRRFPERRPTATADELEAALRRENPKGTLWARCAQLRIDAPRVRHRVIGSTHQAEMTLEIGEWELWSGVQSGGARGLVEQLAARELLGELERLLVDERPDLARVPAGLAGDEDDVWEVSAADVERLRRENPKGAVFEWCQKRRPPVARPRFEVRRAPGGGVHVRATLVTLHLSSPWFRASQAKLAEQAAAEALLPLLPDAEEGSPAERLDPRAALSELRQRGAIADYAFEVAPKQGPGSVRFTVVGRVVLPSGAIETSGPMDGASKKEATLLAARALLERVAGAP